MNEEENVMSKQERKRLEKLQSEAGKEAGNFSLEKLTFPDLLLLLRNDDGLRALILEIVEPPAEADAEAAEAPPTASQKVAIESEEVAPPPRMIPAPWYAPPPPPTPPAPVDPLRAQLATELALLKAVRADEELANDWLLPEGENEGQQLIRLIARISQWDTIVDLWDLLANRCKQNKRAASPAERQILAATVKAHNLRWHGRQAKLYDAEVGSSFDFRQHNRGTPTGETICAQWLPGLMNAGGEPQKKPLIET
jgi:hypothetical protein